MEQTLVIVQLLHLLHCTFIIKWYNSLFFFLVFLSTTAGKHLSSIVIGCRQTLWLPIFLWLTTSCIQGAVSCWLPKQDINSAFSQTLPCIPALCLLSPGVGWLTQLLPGWGIAAFARNSLVNRQRVDLIGEGELCAQRGLQQQGYSVCEGDWRNTWQLEGV